MDVSNASGGRVELTMSDDERYLIKQCLNECCFGFRISDFRAKIGAERSAVIKLLDQLQQAKDAPAPGPEELGVTRNENGSLRVALTREQARTFVNCMNETEKAIAMSEFHSRFGAPMSAVKSLFSTIDAACASMTPALPQTKGEWVRVPRGR